MADFYVRRGEKTIGPVAAGKLKEMAAAGKVIETDQLAKSAEGPLVAAREARGPFPSPPSTPPPPAPQPQTKACEFCGEEILAVAKKCKHCGEILDATLREEKSPSKKPKNRWMAVGLSVLIPGLGQLYKEEVIPAILWFVVTLIGYALYVLPGIIVHIFCIVDAGNLADKKKVGIKLIVFFLLFFYASSPRYLSWSLDCESILATSQKAPLKHNDRRRRGSSGVASLVNLTLEHVVFSCRHQPPWVWCDRPYRS